MDNRWMLAAIYPVLIEFGKSIIQYRNLNSKGIRAARPRT
jgi:hypothetical protein